jgi:hypothetical protein
MKIVTAGGDTHFYNDNGKPVPLTQDHIVGITADKAVAFTARFLSMLTGEDIRKFNPPRGKEQDPWRDISDARIDALAEEVKLKDRWKIAKKAMEAEGIKPPASKDGLAIVFYSGNSIKESIASFSINTTNQKTGPSSATNASQASCPNGKNNASGYRCPLLGAGCYAESGMVGTQTKKLNDAVGFSNKQPTVPIPPEEVAKNEARVIELAFIVWRLLRLNNGVRLHVVGDCVTPAAARIANRAAEMLTENHLQGAGVRADKATKNVWNYTHAWRDVPRSAWSPNISVLASCDRIEDLEEAHKRGYGCAVVVPTYVQEKIGTETEKLVYSGKAFTTSNGFKLIPCPHEVQAMNKAGERAWCINCGLCMKDDWLHKNKAAIAFAAHTPASKETVKNLISEIQPAGAKA